jgi:hypothetical protein
MTDTEHVGRHRKTTAHEHRITHIVTKIAHAGIINDGVFYVSLTDADTGNMLGIDFEGDSLDSLRRALRASA